MKKALLLFLLLEILVMVAVVFIFRSIESRLHAGFVAGTLFILLGAAVVGYGLKRSAFRRLPTFYVGCVHLFGVALPMVLFRLMSLESAFSDVRVWGLPGPVFHKVSESVYLLLLIVTAFDAYRSFRADRKA